jgi:type I restriction enzyme, S subunit
MTEWREVVLGDLCDRVTVGHVGKMADEYVEDGVPFLRSQNISPFAINRKGILYINKQFHQRLAKSTLRTGDVVVIRTGYPGTAAVIPPHLDNSNCADLVVITPSDQLNPYMLAAVFNSAWGRSAVGGQLVGSAQQHFNIGSARALRIRLPGRDQQDRIAAILCTLTDLIENNQQRIELLEQMAQAIYREWFVELRYPGYEDMPLVDSDLGPVPDTWEVHRLAHLVSTQYGYTASTLEEPVGPKFLRGMDMNKASFIDWDRVPYCPIDVDDVEKYRLAVGDVLIIRMADPGKVGIVEQEVEAVFASYLVRIRPLIGVPLRPYFLFYFLTSNTYQSFVTGASTGATRKSVSAKVMTDTDLVVPAIMVQEAFEERVGEIRRLIGVLLRANANLRATRDLLLPRLISGEIDVSELDLDGVVDSV